MMHTVIVVLKPKTILLTTTYIGLCIVWHFFACFVTRFTTCFTQIMRTTQPQKKH